MERGNWRDCGPVPVTQPYIWIGEEQDAHVREWGRLEEYQDSHVADWLRIGQDQNDHVKKYWQVEQYYSKGFLTNEIVDQWRMKQC